MELGDWGMLHAPPGDSLPLASMDTRPLLNKRQCNSVRLQTILLLEYARRNIAALQVAYLLNIYQHHMRDTFTGGTEHL